MRRLALALLTIVLATPLAAQQPAGLTGNWYITLDFHGSPIYWPLHLIDTAGVLTGMLDTDTVTGTLTAGHVKFHAQDPKGGYEEVDATLTNPTTLSGTLLWLQDGDTPDKATTHNFTATRQPEPRPGPPQRLEFTPTRYYNQFSSGIAPVAHIFPGDTIHTTTVDAGGGDLKGVTVTRGGQPRNRSLLHRNRHARRHPRHPHQAPQAQPRLRHQSDNGIVQRALDPSFAVKTRDNNQDVRWHLDLANNLATSQLPGDHLKTFAVPLKPMLGCIATAPGGAGVALPTQDSGYFGGNMDFNEVTEGATVYLPVSVPGALLFFGDAHAAQGDGELNGNALETSMDVEVTVELLHNQHLGYPLVENATHLMAAGYEGSVDDSLKSAIDNMATWLEARYKLTPSEIAQVLGTSAEIKIAEVADRNAGVVVKLRKDRLATIQTDVPKPAPTTPPSPTK